MKKFLLLLMALLAMEEMAARGKTVLLFPDGAPGEKVNPAEEKADASGPEVGGLPVLRITDVYRPEITIYPADPDVASGAAMVVCPGGGYNILAYDLEGTEICEWLNEAGITAVLLKYRVPRRPKLSKHIAPLQDVQRAISYVRAHADDLCIDPERIGIMGFSAGAHLSVMASTAFRHRTYADHLVLQGA